MRAYLRVRTLYVVVVPGKISLTRIYLRHETSSTPDRLPSYCTRPCTGTDNGHNPNSYVFFYVSMYDVTLIWGRFQKLNEDFCPHLRKKTSNREACSEYLVAGSSTVYEDSTKSWIWSDFIFWQRSVKLGFAFHASESHARRSAGFNFQHKNLQTSGEVKFLRSFM